MNFDDFDTQIQVEEIYSDDYSEYFVNGETNIAEQMEEMPD